MISPEMFRALVTRGMEKQKDFLSRRDLCDFCGHSGTRGVNSLVGDTALQDVVDNWLMLCGHRHVPPSPGASTAEEGGFSMEVDAHPEEAAVGGAAEDGEGSGGAGAQAQDALAAFLACLRVCRTCKNLATDGVATRLARTLLSDDSVKYILSAAEARPNRMPKDVSATLLGVLPLQLVLQDSFCRHVDALGWQSVRWVLSGLQEDTRFVVWHCKCADEIRPFVWWRSRLGFLCCYTKLCRPNYHDRMTLSRHLRSG